MTRRTFYKQLAKIQNKFAFETRSTTNYIRAFLREDRCLCPITAVFYSKFGYFLSSHKYVEAATKLGLSEKDACLIAGSADNYKSGKHGTKVNPQVRRALLRATGLLK